MQRYSAALQCYVVGLQSYSAEWRYSRVQYSGTYIVEVLHTALLFVVVLHWNVTVELPERKTKWWLRVQKVLNKHKYRCSPHDGIVNLHQRRGREQPAEVNFADATGAGEKTTPNGSKLVQKHDWLTKPQQDVFSPVWQDQFLHIIGQNKVIDPSTLVPLQEGFLGPTHTYTHTWPLTCSRTTHTSLNTSTASSILPSTHLRAL